MDEAEGAAERSATVHAIEVTVTRTGGFAGVRRRWHAAADPEEGPRLAELVRRCPWDGTPGHDEIESSHDDAATGPARGADRFVWFIWARLPTEEREAELPESAVAGPWRELIAEVQRVGDSQRPLG